jgi:hypothetical protein
MIEEPCWSSGGASGFSAGVFHRWRNTMSEIPSDLRASRRGCVNFVETFSVLTMSSREIAALTGKRHDNVRADIEKMGLELSLKFQEKVEPSFGGRPSRVCYLTKRETMILVTGYSVALRARVVDRWMELQEAAAICMEVMQIGHLVSAQFSADWSDALGIVGGPPKIP